MKTIKIETSTCSDSNWYVHGQPAKNACNQVHSEVPLPEDRHISSTQSNMGDLEHVSRTLHQAQHTRIKSVPVNLLSIKA